MGLSQDDETALIRQVNAGNSDAFNRLWSAHQEALFGFIRWQVRCPDADRVAREILADSYLFLKSHISKYDPNRSRFRTFAKLLVDSLRKKRLRRGREISVSWVSDPDEDDPATRLPEPQDPRRSVEDELIRYEEATRLLRMSFSLSSPPHQLVVFGFNRLLSWKPKDIVKNLWQLPLSELEARLEDDFVAAAAYDEDFVRGCFRDLRQRMEVTFGCLVSHPKARQAYRTLLERVTGKILLRDFYDEERDPEDSVCKWANNVWKSLRIRMLEELCQKSRPS